MSVDDDRSQSDPIDAAAGGGGDDGESTAAATVDDFDTDTFLPTHGGLHATASMTHVGRRLEKVMVPRSMSLDIVLAAEASQQFRTTLGALRPGLYAWGNAARDQLGLSVSDVLTVPEPRRVVFYDALYRGIVGIACGNWHTVVHDCEHGIFSFGENERGQLGHRKATSRPALVPAFETMSVKMVACGGEHTIAIVGNGRHVYGWGDDSYGQLGLGTDGGASTERPKSDRPRLMRIPPARVIVQVACGGRHTLLLSGDGRVWACGDNASGQLGVETGTEGTIRAVREPMEVRHLTLVPLRQLAAGGAHSVALAMSGSAFVWGANESGQLGLGDTLARRQPVLQTSLQSQHVVYVACSEAHTVALTARGALFTCGAGMHGQLGHGTVRNEHVPRQVLELMGSAVTQVTCGRRHTLAYVGSTKALYAFGLGGSGQLGLGDGAPKIVATPQRVQLLETAAVVALAAGGEHSVALVGSGAAPHDDRVQDESRRPLTLNAAKVATLFRLPAAAIHDALRTVFSSPACLNGSFVQPEFEAGESTAPGHGVNLADLRDFYGMLAARKDSGAAIMARAVQQLMDDCGRWERTYAAQAATLHGGHASLLPFALETLRLYLMVLCMPMLSDAAQYQGSLRAIVQALHAVAPARMAVLGDWWCVGAPCADAPKRPGR